MKPPGLFCFLTLVLSMAALGQLKNNGRITPALRNVLAQKKDKELVNVLVTIKDLSQLHQDNDISIVSEYAATHTVLIKISVAKLNTLLEKNEIIFADKYRAPKDELTTGSLDISLNKISYAHAVFPDINGDSINVSIKEQRFDTSDIDIRGRHFESGVSAAAQSSHAAIMATILAGAGNSSPFARGAAPGSNLTSSDYTSLLPDADVLYQQFKILVQNHSYGTGIENFYGSDAASYDMTVWKNPLLLHVFSSGNSGTDSPPSGSYSGIAGFANLTGSFKMAKNIITVGATDSFNVVASLSSKGPAFDGRIKPELVAFGEDGSSGAAALVSGTAALVQQSYRNQFHSLPTAALVKSVLLNSADDIGQKHIDYVSGFGSLNTYAALNTIKENRFFESDIRQNEIKTFPVSIPAGMAQFKITVAWTDTAASPNAAKVLVNDLDALLTLPATNESWNPWVLKIYPNMDSLVLPAIRKIDTLNNAEQITIDNPQSGNYVFQITGSKIQTSKPQAFAIAYQFDTVNNFKWTFPASNDVLTASKKNIIHWQTNITGSASIEYSANGLQWQTIASSVDLSSQYFKWDVPDTMTTAFLRIQLPSLPPVTSGEFVISKPISLNVGFNCVDSFLLYWNQFTASRYQIYRLGEKYLEPLQILTDSFVVYQKTQHPDLYYSIAPIINNKAGQRSFTINYATQGVGCYVKSFFALLQNQPAALLTAELGSLYNVSEISFQKITSAGIQDLKTVSNPSSLSLSFIDLQLTQGANVYRLRVKLSNGSFVYSDNDLVYYFPQNPVLVYPNPSQQNQPIKIIAQDPGIYSIMVYDANGRLIHQQMLDKISQQLQIFSLPAGLYLLKVTNDGGRSFTQKLVVY